MPMERIWDTFRIRELVRLWNEGQQAPAIARRLGLSRYSIESRLAKLRRDGAPLARRRSRLEAANPRAGRRCLYCNREFPSEHVGNRICPTCLEDGPFTSALV